MNNFTNPFNLVLWFVVLSFWGTAMLLARGSKQRSPATLKILPAFFLLVGVGINLYLMPWGTYIVASIHALMMPALFRIARTRP